MLVIAVDVDPSTVEFRTRDTEHLNPPADPPTWSPWAPLTAWAGRTDEAEYLALLLASAIDPALEPGATSTVTVTLTIAANDAPVIRTLDTQLRHRP